MRIGYKYDYVWQWARTTYQLHGTGYVKGTIGENAMPDDNWSDLLVRFADWWGFYWAKKRELIICPRKIVKGYMMVGMPEMAREEDGYGNTPGSRLHRIYKVRKGILLADPNCRHVFGPP